MPVPAEQWTRFDLPRTAALAARAFIIRVLSKETRPDNFVTATISREEVKRNRWSAIPSAALLGMWGDDREYLDVYDLNLNCSMKRAQLRITFTPMT
jgi:hypothetical protein